MKILVTGGAGYIGSHMVKMLCDENCEVVVVDNLRNGHRQAVDSRAKFVEGNISDKQKIMPALQGCRAVIHFAGFIEAGLSMKEPEKFFKNNVSEGINLLEAMKKAEVKNIIFSSSAAIFGSPKYIPIDENHPKNPENFYGQTKLFFEQILEWYEKLYGFKYISLRYFNAAGADPSGKLGESHLPETHLIPVILQAALGQRENIKIFGTDYETPDGTCIRDYIHVNDLCRAHLLALNYLLENNLSNCFNLGTGIGTSVKEVINACEKATGKIINRSEEGKRAGDPPILVASAEKAKRILGWKPRDNDINFIIKTAWNWHQACPEGYFGRSSADWRSESTDIKHKNEQGEQK